MRSGQNVRVGDLRGNKDGARGVQCLAQSDDPEFLVALTDDFDPRQYSVVTTQRNKTVSLTSSGSNSVFTVAIAVVIPAHFAVPL